MSNILIAYFSRAGENYFGGEIRPVSIGNTKICAELLKESLDADVFEIEMKAPYSDNYRECVAQAREDLQKNHLPELKTMPESIADYDVVILGYPNYCSTIPMPHQSRSHRIFPLPFPGYHLPYNLYSRPQTGTEQNICDAPDLGRSQKIHHLSPLPPHLQEDSP